MLKKIVGLNIFFTFGLIIWGGVVHNTASSLACPDWPLCYGLVFPKMEGGILFEHSHRLLGALVGFLTILILFFSFKYKHKKIIFKFSLLALGMVIFQGILGGLTVIYKLPTIISTAHLTLSMIFFCTLIYIFHLIQTEEKTTINLSLLSLEESSVNFFKKNWKTNLKQRVFFSGFIIFLQIILGAFVRHSGAGTACGVGFSNSLLCFDIQKWYLVLWPSIGQAQLQMVHRFLALIIFFIVFIVIKQNIVFFKNIAADKKSSNWQKHFFIKSILFLSYLLIFLLIIQIGLGVLTVATSIGVMATTLHLAVGALLLALHWYLFLKLKFLEENHFNDKLHTMTSDFIDLTKPKLSALVIFTVLIGIILAPVNINFFKAIFALFLVAMNVWGAGALNCYIEKDIDFKMNRTKNRPLPSGRMNPTLALIFGIFLTLSSFFLLLIFVNKMSALLSLIALISYLFIYTPMKMNAPSAVIWGAIPGALPPLIGWTIVTGKIDYAGLILFGIIFVWQLPHFLSISIFHLKDYLNAGIKVLPGLIGIYATKLQIVIYTIIMVGMTFLPWSFMKDETSYRWVSVILGLAMILLSLVGLFFNGKSEKNLIWARSYFFGSIIYLPFLLCAMVYFR